MFSRLAAALQGSSLAPVNILSLPTVPTTSIAQQAQASLSTMSSTLPQVGTFANGCYWGTEHIFREHYKGKGLVDAKVGFIGGKESSKNPSYEEVCTGRTGHAEACQVKFDPSKVSYAELVEFFYRTHDPTQMNQQGNDRGTQYRSALFPHDVEQLEIAKKVTQEVQEKHFTSKGQKIVTQIDQRPADHFFEADKYHQEYLYKHPNGYQCANHRLWW
ncbi:PMSR-domain-containing protein [Tilletiaria anomala UBC 951]|uniref:peptide-methionine (S)-S-oxide reductase n=1 Tax=Tilletiaria anomala (strain ATCC 24038 / CBS 436.72 / UBC 951) TaxID=1037660 RepID=A0A066WIM4_TILAU|nr:PMSR-domain-containing protein [Tilletiaria anomala UBC 951]KDN50859.1 PMSR-domain-containing protein [Tilletiaria anomala UBC 951]